MADTGDLAPITELMIQYCDLIDCGDLAGCAALFEKGAWGIVGTLAQGAEEVSAQLDNVTLYDGRPNTRHLMSNVAINVDPSGQTAVAKSCITVMQHVPVSLFVFFISHLALSVHTPKTKEALTMSASQIM